MIVPGSAGTGKSFVVRSVMKYVRDSYGARGLRAVRVAAPTGTAAFNIGGVTLHSLLRLPVPLTDAFDVADLGDLQGELEDLRVLLVDEMSMVGRRMLGGLDKVLRAAFPHKRKLPFGGVSIVLFGDFGQLPPVLDLSMYSDADRGSLSNSGRTTFRAFRDAAVLDEAVRSKGESDAQRAFRGMLMRLRNGEVTKEDWAMLMTRTKGTLSQDEVDGFRNAPRVVATHDVEAEYNAKSLRELRKPVMRIDAAHSSAAARTPTAEETSGLQATLHLAEGARVILRQNLWTPAGLTNGALGVVIGAVWAPGQSAPQLPAYVLVEFDKYTGPQLVPGHPNVVPIPPTTYRWKKGEVVLSRTQVPLNLAFAITIHKSQGWTRDKIVIDWGLKEFALGISFVAVSRAKSLAGILLDPQDTRALEWPRLERINDAKGHVGRRAIDIALRRMHARTEARLLRD